ncbi:hypothetical protein EJB05_29901 [Eragrostis curvula]|uniref:Uncharacterized protein n=1 Tax=Eragrostis curvula TaxID=38414 RepID=A0A5J9UW80_9POAL|nr:hypothetical protein EJB05_29901 [Eragrostis curvula]
MTALLEAASSRGCPAHSAISDAMALLEQSSIFWNIWATSSERSSACSAGRTMARSWVTKDCSLAISFITNRWSHTQEGGEYMGRSLDATFSVS